MTRFRAPLLLLAGALLAGPLAPAAQAQAPVTVETSGGEVTVLADRIEQAGADNLLIATGNVEITRGRVRLVADRVEINRETGDATAQGRVILYDGEDRLVGDRIEYNLKTGTGVAYEGRMQAAPYYRLSGERIERLGESVYHVRRGVFTTCEDEPPPWSFRFGDARADLEDFIYGTNASFWVKNIPLIPYLPAFAAAIRRERQTGFLPPVYGSSSRRGAFIEVPFFWAISDSQDATFTLDYFQRLGFGGSAEYRYVLSERQRGTLSGFVVNESNQSGDTRGWGRFLHDWTSGSGQRLLVDLNHVSDNGVLRLYEEPGQRRLALRTDSNVSYTKTWPNWTFVARAYAYQDLTTTLPVELQRLPELTLRGIRQPLPGLSGTGILYQVDTSATRFYRELGSEGTRLDLRPRLSRPINLAGYATLTPFVGGRVTAYDVTVTDTGYKDGVFIEHTKPEERVRELGEIGADATSRVARVYQTDGLWGLQSVLHSVEPGARYVRVFGHNLYSLPIWDYLVDQVPEASWIEYSVTNRLRGRTVSPDGTEARRVELARLTLAHAYDVEGARWGNLAADLLVQISDRVQFRGDVSYNLEHGLVHAGTTDVSVTLPFGTAHVGTRFDRRPWTVPEWVQLPGTWNPGLEASKTAGVNYLQGGFTAELSRDLVARAETNWDLGTGRVAESRVGIDYKFQCWALSIEYIRSDYLIAGLHGNNEVRFKVSLLGVGVPLGTKLGASETGGLRVK